LFQIGAINIDCTVSYVTNRKQLTLYFR